jgi:DNA-binding protein YbaB
MKGKLRLPAQGARGLPARMQQVQRALAQAQADLREETVEVHAGVAIRIELTGSLRCRSAIIAPGSPQSGDVELPQDAVVPALRAALAMTARRVSPPVGGTVTGT